MVASQSSTFALAISADNCLLRSLARRKISSFTNGLLEERLGGWASVDPVVADGPEIDVEFDVGGGGTEGK